MNHGTRSSTSLVFIKQPTNQKGRCVVFRNPHHRPSSYKTPSFRATATAGVVSTISAMLSDGTPRPTLPIARVQKPLTQLTKLASSRMHTESIPHPRCAIHFSCPISQRLDQEDLGGKSEFVPCLPCHAMPYSGNPVAVHSTQVP